MRLTDDEFETLRTYTSSYNIVEILDFVAGEKPLFHISSYDPHPPNSILSYLTSIGFDAKLEPIEGTDKYKLHISDDQSVLQKAVESSQNELTELLGYPSCCVNDFSTSTEDDRILRKIQSVEQYPFYMNRLSRTHAILSHFPCTFDCEPSMEIGERRYDLLKETYPQIAEEFKQELTALYVYISERGLYEATEYSIEDQTGENVTVNYKQFDPVKPLNPHTIIPDPDKTVLKQLNQTNTATIVSHNHIKTDEMEINDPSLRVTMFG